MSKRIRSMIDEIFSDMKMTAENLALRDELMANALSRYEDTVSQGRSEEEAFEEVASSLEDVQSLLEEMNRMDAQQPQQETEEEAPELKTGTEAQKEEETLPRTDLGDALNKAFSALGDFSQSFVPEAKRLVREVDGATGGVLGKLGRAAQKGMRDAQKAAGEALDKLSKEQGELVFDFGPKKQKKEEEDFSEFDVREPKHPAPEGAVQEASVLREQAKDLRAEAALKDVTGDREGAQALIDQANALETRADALDQAAAMEAAQAAAKEAEQLVSEAEAEKNGVQETAEEAETDEAARHQNTEPLVDEAGEVDQDVLSKVVEDVAREAEKAVHQAASAVNETVGHVVEEVEYVVRGANEPVSGRMSFSAAGLHGIDIQLDADDVQIMPAQGDQIETLWEARNVDGEPVVTLENHKLVIRRKNPDVFKTFFSVFAKDGGKITVCVPFGYAAAYKIQTTSGDVLLRGVDVDDVQVNTTSGCVRLEPDTKTRANRIAVTTVSGHATVSACADDVAVTTVSGDQFISCDALKVDVNVVSGKVHAEGACEEWEISAVSGDVEMLCTIAPTKKVLISSMHANVRLALPDDIRGFAAEIKGPLGCELINEFGPNRYGTCALPIRMETMRGRLMITRL